MNIMELKKLMTNRLTDFSELEDGFDGGRGIAINKDVIQTVKGIIENLDETILINWNIFPGVNGDISFDFRNQLIGGVDITPKYVIWASKNDEGKVISGKQPVSVEACVNVIKIITSFLTL